MEIRHEGMLEDHVKFSEDEIVIVKTALKTKLFRRDEPMEVRVGKFQVMLTALSEKFGIPEVRFEKEEGDDVGASFLPEANKIVAQRYSLVSILMAFGTAIKFHKNQNLAEGAEELYFDSLGFGLSAFKQAAPVMFELAKTNGRLCGTTVPYTDGGRIQPCSDDGDGDDGDDGDGDDGPAMRPDIDPENRPDRGNGPGED